MFQEWGVILLLILLTLSAWLSSPQLAVTPLAYLALLVISIYIRSSREQARLDFVNQLKSCRRDLRRGGSVLVDGIIVHAQSSLTTYQLVVGGLLSNVAIPSRFRLAREGNHFESVLYSVLSLLTGWWSLPHGPLATLGAVGTNLTGGERISVRHLIDGPIPEAPAAKPPECQSDTGPGSPSGSHLRLRSLPGPLSPPQLRKKPLAESPPPPHPSKLPEQLKKPAKSDPEKSKSEKIDRSDSEKRFWHRVMKQVSKRKKKPGS